MQHLELLKSKTILIVEDERIIRENLASMLGHFFKKVYTAMNGLDGLEEYEEHLPDIIMTDLKMPHMGGYEMLERIGRERAELFTIIVSAHTDTDLLLHAIHSGVDRYITKPITEEQLFGAFEVYIQKLGSSEEIFPIDEVTAFDPNRSAILRDSEEIPLNNKEMLLLKLLYKEPQSVHTYESIESSVWGSKPMTPSAIRSVIRDLRKKLGGDYIRNVSGMGYRLR